MEINGAVEWVIVNKWIIVNANSAVTLKITYWLMFIFITGAIEFIITVFALYY